MFFHTSGLISNTLLLIIFALTFPQFLYGCVRVCATESVFALPSLQRSLMSAKCHKKGVPSTRTVLGEFGGAHQGGDAEAVSGADRQTPTAGHAAGAAAQCCPLADVAVVVAGRLQR